MKILMLGWELPPFFAGGVGVVCYEITKALGERNDVEVTYVMPYGKEESMRQGNIDILFANLAKISEKLNINLHSISTLLYNYDSPESYDKRFKNYSRELKSNREFKTTKELYGENILQEVYLYAIRVLNLCKNMDFDVIHAHDWTTIPAALMLRELTGKPIVLHVHITELNKTGGSGGHPQVLDIEKLGFKEADKIIAISHQIKNMLIDSYGTDHNKIEIIHNGELSSTERKIINKKLFKKNNEKIILYAGRVTLQKGPEYFVKAAKIVCEYHPNVKFIMAGNGEKLDECINLAKELGIYEKFYFHGFYTREEADEFFSMADVFVMPSVLEPFGIVPLEAAAKGTPTIISKQSGISEVFTNTFKIDFWDTEEMAHKMLGLIKYEKLNDRMKTNAFKELDNFSWNTRAEKMVNLYKKLVGR